VRVPLVRDEEQPRVEPPQPVRAVDEVVAAPEQAGPAVLVRVGQPHVRDLGYDRRAVGALDVEVDLVELVLPAQRRAGALGPPDDRLLLHQRGTVPGLDEHPDLAGDRVRPTLHPGRSVAGPHPQVLAEQRPLLGLQVGGAVLEAEEVARRRLGGRRRRGAPEAELRPPHADRAEPDAGQVADRVHGHLRVVRARLHAQVATGDLRIERVTREARQIGQRGRALGGEPEPVDAVRVAEERRAEADGQCEAGRWQPERLTGVVRRRLGDAVDRADEARVLARGHPGGRLGPLAQHLDQPVATLRDHVERDEVQPILGRCDDAGLPFPVELDGAGHARGGRLVVPQQRGGARRRARANHADSRQRDGPTPVHRALLTSRRPPPPC
jgi:hypothetical protein